MSEKDVIFLNRYQAYDLRMGGMGIVYYCIDQKLGLPIALKTYQKKFIDNWEMQNLFVDECVIISKKIFKRL